MADVYSAICFGGLNGKTVTLTIASPCVVSLTNHGMRPGTGIVLSTTGALPTGLTAGTTYYVGNVASGTFNLYDTKANAQAGGSTGKINTSGTQSGTHTAKSAVMLATDLSRYGSTRVYDGIASWNSGRSGASAYDTEYAEILEAFTDSITSALTISVPSAKSVIWSKVNGARSGAYHNGNVPKTTDTLQTLTLSHGYAVAVPSSGYLSNYMLIMNRYRDTIDGILLTHAAAGGTYALARLTGGQSRVSNCVVTQMSGAASTTGISLGSALTECVGNVITGCGTYGIDLVPNLNGIFICNNTITKCGTGILSTASAKGFCYNNIVVGNTTNWSPATMPSPIEGASHNCTPTGQGWATSGGTLINIATTDFANYTNNDFYPASVSSPQVEVGIAPYGYPTEDIAGRERPNYMNGGAEAMDIGAHEYDHGYGNHPSANSRGLAFTGLVAGSKVKVFLTGTDTEKFSTASSGTSETWSESVAGSLTVDYVILKAGYLPIRVTGVTVTASPSGPAATPITQSVARWYQASSGLTLNTNCFANATTKKFGLTAVSTLQNLASYLLEQWITLGDTGEAYANKPFPIEANGPNSFSWLDGWEADLSNYASTITNLRSDGMRYITSGGAVAAVWIALITDGIPSGLLMRYQQVEGAAPTDAAATGNVNQLIQVYGDSTHGNYDRTGYLVCKVQEQGYDQASVDVVAQYGTLEDQLYVIALIPQANGVAAANPTVSDVTITDHGASPVTWNSKAFSITITDSGTTPGQTIMQWIRRAQDVGGTFQGKDGFNWHDLVQTNGDKFKGVRGALYGDTGATLKGVRVLRGTDAHPDFTLHTADDGTTVSTTPPAQAVATILADSRIQLYNVTTSTELDNSFQTGTTYANTLTAGVSVGDTLRLRVCKLGYDEAEAFAVWTASGCTFLVNQSANAVYAAWGIDGSTVTEFSGDVTGHIYIDSNDPDGATTKTRLGAWYSWVLTTEIGIRHFYKAVTYLAANSIRVNVDVADIMIENVNATTALRFTDTDVRLYRSDGTSIIAPTSYSIHNDYSGVPDVSVVTVSGSNVITGDIADIPAAVLSASAGSRTVSQHLQTQTAILANKIITNPATGKITVYADDSTTPLLTADIFKDAAGTTPYNGTGAERREKLA